MLQVSIPLKRLQLGILSTDMSFILNNILRYDGVVLSSSDFGNLGFGTFRNAAGTQIEFFIFDPTTIANSSITILYRGLDYKGGIVDGAETKYDWNANETIVVLGSNPPALWSYFVDLGSTQTITGQKTFSVPPIGINPGGQPDAALGTKGVVSLSTSPNKTLGTATITIASPAVVTFNNHNLIAGDAIQFTTTGFLPTGLSPSTNYYVISTGLTTNTFEIAATIGGTAINTSGTQSGTHTLLRVSPIVVTDVDPRLPTQAQANALTGTGNPSSTDPFVNLSTISGIISAYGGIVAPTGWLLCDASAISRVTYPNLFAVLNPSLGTATMTIASPAVVTLNSHGLVAGDTIFFNTTGALPTGVVAGTKYFVISAGLTTNAFEFSATLGGSAINTTGSQSGVHTLKRSPYGVGDGSTTFNVPDLRTNVPVGYKSADGSFGVIGTALGEKTHQLTTGELASHSHNVFRGGSPDTQGNAASNGMNLFGGASPAVGVTASAGSDTAHNNIQPSLTVQYIIKT